MLAGRVAAGSEVSTCSALGPHGGGAEEWWRGCRQEHNRFKIQGVVWKRGWVLARSPRVSLQDVYWGCNRAVEEPGNVQTN